MFGEFDKYIAAFLTALLVAYLFTPFIRKLAVRFGVVDLPNERRPHRRATARGGGIAVFAGVQAACVLVLALSWPAREGGFDADWWRWFTPASLLLLIVGVIDDVRGLRPMIKLGGQILAALIVCLSGTHFGSLFGFKLPWILDVALVVLWIVAVINAFNLIDGLDGLASGLAIISAIGLCGILVLGNLPGTVLVLVALIGACLGFLRYNFHPATIFLGDSGSMFIGFTLGVISLQTFTKSTFVLSLAIPLLVLGVPMYDELLAVWRRSVRIWLAKRRAQGTPGRHGLMQPDIDHLHHRLIRAGLSARRVATALCALNAGLVLFGLLISVFRSRAAGIFLIALLAAAYVVLRHLTAIELRDTGQAILSGLRRPNQASMKALAYPVWDMAWMAAAVALSMWAFEGRKSDFWHTWFLELPVWVTPTFSLLAISRTYVTVWTRARMLDVLMLISTLVVGLLLSIGIALLIDPAEARQWLIRALLVGCLSHPAIVFVRVIYRVTEELVIYFRNKTEQNTATERVLLYGAGGRCQLFLKERGLNPSRSHGEIIVGLIDDDAALHAEWVYGYLVLGGLKNLPQLIARHRITAIVITATLRLESRTAVEAIARQLGLPLHEWSVASRTLDPSAQSSAARERATALVPETHHKSVSSAIGSRSAKTSTLPLLPAAKAQE